MFDRFFEENIMDEEEMQREREEGPWDHPANEPLTDEEVEALVRLAEVEFGDSDGPVS